MGLPIPNHPALKGPFTPMRFEATVEDCIVTEGEIPKELRGGFYRCGPTYKRPSRQGTVALLTLDGMVQGLVFENGKATFRNRWVRTPKYLLEEEHGQGMFEWEDGDFGDYRTWGYSNVTRDEYTTGIPQGSSNINIFPFAGQMLSLGEEGTPPIAIDPISLETKGMVPWSKELTGGLYDKKLNGSGTFTAHPKWDHSTGEVFGWTYGDEPPYVTMHNVRPDGTVRTLPLHDAPYNTVAHDVWLTPEWIVMPFQPFIIGHDRVHEGKGVFGWDPELPIVLAIIPRSLEGDVRWITTDLEPQYVMHTMAANVDGSKLILDAPIFDRPPFPTERDLKNGEASALFFSVAKSMPGRWTVDLDTGKVSAEQLSDRPAELPKVDERHYGQNYNFGFMIAGDPKRHGMSMKSLLVQDPHTLAEQEYRIRNGEPAAVLEGTFAPRKHGSAEGDGYVIVPVSKWAANLGEYLIFDTDDITAGPVARIEIPFRLGWNAHGHWMSFDDIPGG